MTDTASRRTRLEELLVQRATEGLDPTEQETFDQLAAELPDVDTTALDRIAATIWLAASRERAAMPAALRQRILGSAIGTEE